MLDLGNFSCDLKRIFRFIRKDMTDDWLKDPLNFDDRLNNEVVFQYFHDNIKENGGIYKPSSRIVVNLPKNQFTLRYSLETNIFDRIAYHIFGTFLIEHFDKLIPNRVFSHRFNKLEFKKKNPRYLFYNPIEQWKKFHEFVRIDSHESCILATDVQNYFEHININKLQKILLSLLKELDVSHKEMADIRFCIDSICNCLEFWSFDNNQGLPQNRDISSFLANIYMIPVDRKMIELDFDYYRYVDDIKIICKDKFHAREFLQIISCELRKYNLTLNGSKTKILELGTDEHGDFIKDKNFELERIDALFRTKKKSIVSIAFKEVREELDKCISKKEYDSREFRFYLNRISKIALCEDIAKPEGYFDGIINNFLEALISHPTNTDYFYNILSTIQLNDTQLQLIYLFLQNSEKSIYTWQNYLIWKILILNNYNKKQVVKYAKSIICLKEENIESIDKAGALLFVGKFGTLEDKKEIVSLFRKDLNFIIQRHFLICFQELEFGLIKEIKDLTSKEQKNTYKNLYNQDEHKYISRPKSIDYKDIINELGYYI